MKPFPPVALLVVSLLVSALSDAQAQGTRLLKGTVLDSANHKPVSRAAIYLGRAATGQRTANDGTFSVPAEESPQILMVRLPGYVPAFVAVPAGAAGTETDLGTTSVRRVKTDADRADAQAADVTVYPELVRFYDHMKRYPNGLFLRPDDLQRVGGSLFDLIRQKPGFHFICYTNRRGETDCGQQANRGRGSIMGRSEQSPEQQACLLEVWTNDQVRQWTLDEVQMDDVLAVEAYPNPGTTPQDFAGSPCAAVMLYMKRLGS
jgi:hypothetical protein